MIEYDLRDFVLSVPAVTALVGTGAQARVYPTKLPQGVRKGLVYTTISKTRDYTFDGRSGFALARVQLDLVDLEAPEGHTAYKEAKAALDALREVLDGYAGPMGASIVQRARVEGDRDEWDETVRAFVVGVDVLLEYDEG